MSQNQQTQNKSEVTNSANVQHLNEQPTQANKNSLYPPVEIPKHNVQDDIKDLNNFIEKKRNSQRKSVFSNHEDQNLSHLIQQHKQEEGENDKKENIQQNQGSNPHLLVPEQAKHTVQDDIKDLNNFIEKKRNSQRKSVFSNHEDTNLSHLTQKLKQEQEENDSQKDQKDVSPNQGSNPNLLAPEKTKHTVQDDIKELKEQIDQRKNSRRASQFAFENTSHIQENEGNKENEEEESEDEDDDDDEDNNIQSLNNLQKKKKKKGSQKHVKLEEDDSQQKQKSIKELEEEAKNKPNAYNEVVKLNSSIQQKKELKRKSTFSVPLIQDDEDEDEKKNKQNKSPINNAIKEDEEIQANEAQEQQDDEIRKKPNALNEIVKLNNEIQNKRVLKKKSTFSIPAIQDEDVEDKPKSVYFKETEQIQEDPQQEDASGSPPMPAQKSNALNEIIKLNDEIVVKRQLSRKSTFSVAAKDEDNEDQEENAEESSPQNQQTNNDANTKDGKKQETQQKKQNALNEIIDLNNKINIKKQLSRKSTFNLQRYESQNDEDDDENEKDENRKNSDFKTQLNDEYKEKVIENVDKETLESANKKPNAFNEIVKFNEEIQHKRDSKRKSTFSIPIIKDEDVSNEKDDGDQAEKKNEEQSVQKKPNSLNEIINLNNQIHKKNDLKRKSTFSMPVIEDHDSEEDNKDKSKQKKEEEKIEEVDDENENEEARIRRQKKKKNIMDYKQEQNDEQQQKPVQENQTNEKKMIFFKDSNKANNRKVIHPTSKSPQPRTQNKEEEQVKEIEVVTNQQKVNEDEKQVEQENIVHANKSADQSLEQEPLNIDIEDSPIKMADKKQKQKDNDRRDEFALQRKLEFLTAKSAKNELYKKEQNKIPHNKFIAQELTKEVKIREANKRKRELEQMLAQINREIQFIRTSDPDYDSLVSNNLHIKSMQEQQNPSRSQNNKNDPLNGGNSQFSNTDKKNLQRNQVILPAIKKNNQIKEMIKIAEDQQANSEALSLVQKMKKEKDLKRQKRNEEFQHFNDQILKDVELRRQQNESLHEKIVLEKRQKLLHKKQQYENKKVENDKLVIASKNFVKDLRQIGPGKVEQIDNDHKFGQYQTPELDAHKLGLQQIRNLAKGEFSGGGSVPHFMSNKAKDNSELKKLLEENQINRDREIKITENRKDLHNKRMEYSKSLKNNFLRGGKKMDVSSNLIFQEEGMLKNSSQGNLHASEPNTKRKLQNEQKNPMSQKSQNSATNLGNTNEIEQQQNEEVYEEVQAGNSSSTKSNNVKIWRVKH